MFANAISNPPTYLKLPHSQIYNNFALLFGISLVQQYPIFATIKNKNKNKEFKQLI